MNIYVTNICNQRCPYCYAGSMLDGASPRKRHMTFGDFKKVLRFFEKSGYGYCRFEGGEPTLHPRFSDLLDYAVGRGFRIQLFTNGLFDRSTLACLKEHGDTVNYTWNINHPSLYKGEQWKRIQSNLKQLSKIGSSTLGVNIYRSDQKYEFIYELIRRYNIRKFRFCFAHPDEGSEGKKDIKYIRSRDLPRVLPRVVKFVKKLIKEGIDCYYDCGFLPCQWRDEDLGFLYKHGFYAGACQPCPGITVDLDVVHCFQMSNEYDKRPLSDFENVDEIYSWIEGIFDRYRNVNFYKGCSSCSINNMGMCTLGCIAERKIIARKYRESLEKLVRSRPTKDHIMSLAYEYLRCGDKGRARKLLNRHDVKSSLKEVLHEGDKKIIVWPATVVKIR